MRTLPVTTALTHIWRSTFSNLSFAFHVSWPWMVLIVPVNLVGNLYGFPMEPSANPPEGPQVAVQLIVGLLTLFAFASVAVSWHLYILKDEVPQGWARLRADDRVWRYFGNMILVVIILFLGALPAGFVLGLIGSLLGSFGQVLFALGFIAIAVAGIAAFYRLSVKLPAVALGDTVFSFKDAWAATKGNNWPLIGLGLILIVIVLGLGVAVGLLSTLLLQVPTAGIVMFTVAQIAANWIGTIIGVTTLTSLYGFFVQKREF